LNRLEFEFVICLIERSRGGLGPPIAELGWRIHELNLSRRFYNPVNVVHVIFALYRFFRREKPDVVHTQSVNANVLGRVAAKIARVPIVVATDNAPPEYEARRFVRMFNSLVNNLLDRLSDCIVAASEEILRQKEPKGRSREYHVISTPASFGNPVGHTVYHGESGNHRNSDERVVGVVGRLSLEKGQTYLIEAMPDIVRRFPKTLLLIVGDGPLEGELRRQVRALKLDANVEFAGFIPHSHIWKQWQRIDIAVVPSIHDACPVVTLEAMTAGLPLVGTNVGGIPEVALDGVTAIIVPPRDPVALRNAVIHLLERPADAVEMGRQGRLRALSEFDLSRFVERHANIYRRLTRRSFHDEQDGIYYLDGAS